MDVKTRWNSTCDMLERVIKLKQPLVTFFSIYDSDLKKKNDVRLTLPSEAWLNFEKTREYLLPFKKATLMTTGEK